MITQVTSMFFFSEKLGGNEEESQNVNGNPVKDIKLL